MAEADVMTLRAEYTAACAKERWGEAAAVAVLLGFGPVAGHPRFARYAGRSGINWPEALRDRSWSEGERFLIATAAGPLACRPTFRAETLAGKRTPGAKRGEARACRSLPRRCNFERCVPPVLPHVLLDIGLCILTPAVIWTVIWLFAEEDEPDNEIRHHDDPPERASRGRDQAVIRLAA